MVETIGPIARALRAIGGEVDRQPTGGRRHHAPVLRLPGQWVWDSWVADDGERFHLFFLKSPAFEADPVRRHTAATVGHATSADLVAWTLEPDALLPKQGAWDDLAVWTGSVAREDGGRWLLFYTALSTRPGHGIRDQRIGLAESEDLRTWRRVGDRPLVAPDPRWYRTLEDDPAASETWRDPFVFRDPGGDGWHMLVTARAPGAPRLRDGVLGHARSADLRHWELRPPLTAPAGFGQLEVPQVRLVDGQPLLVFSCHPEEQDPTQVARHGSYTTWYVPGASLTGPWDVARARPFEDDPRLFAAPLVRRRDRTWAFIGFRHLEPEGAFAYEIRDPLPVAYADGALRARTG
jgi:sucrose-6-phosphate hydrolase SacC (GH32 family)